MYNLLAANSELVCYFIIVLNNVVSASVISLVLPILVFLWAMLAVPRPTKRFWMTAIVYTEVWTLRGIQKNLSETFITSSASISGHELQNRAIFQKTSIYCYIYVVLIEYTLALVFTFNHTLDLEISHHSSPITELQKCVQEKYYIQGKTSLYTLCY